jgi:hypothetical protein
VAKLVRFKGPLLEIPPELAGTVRVIHLVRHPLEILRSQMNMGFGTRVNGTRISNGDHEETICQLLVDKMKYLSATIPEDHLHRIRYDPQPHIAHA